MRYECAGSRLSWCTANPYPEFFCSSRLLQAAEWLARLYDETLKLAANPKVTFADRISLTIQELQLEQATVKEVVDYTWSGRETSCSNRHCNSFGFQGKGEQKERNFESTVRIACNMETGSVKCRKAGKILRKLTSCVTLEYAFYYNDARMGLA